MCRLCAEVSCGYYILCAVKSKKQIFNFGEGIVRVQQVFIQSLLRLPSLLASQPRLGVALLSSVQSAMDHSVKNEDATPLVEEKMPVFQNMTSFRNMLVHRYEKIDDEIVLWYFSKTIRRLSAVH